MEIWESQGGGCLTGMQENPSVQVFYFVNKDIKKYP